jgi:RNA polymerase sigma-70 factor (ECF subfamily)
LHHDTEAAKPEDDPYASISLYKTGTPVHAAVEMLNERERYLVGLAFFRGLTHQEISEHTAMPVGTVKTVIRKALSLLRERLHHHGVVEEPR